VAAISLPVAAEVVRDGREEAVPDPAASLLLTDKVSEVGTFVVWSSCGLFGLFSARVYVFELSQEGQGPSSPS